MEYTHLPTGKIVEIPSIPRTSTLLQCPEGFVIVPADTPTPLKRAIIAGAWHMTVTVHSIHRGDLPTVEVIDPVDGAVYRHDTHVEVHHNDGRIDRYPWHTITSWTTVPVDPTPYLAGLIRADGGQ